MREDLPCWLATTTTTTTTTITTTDTAAADTDPCPVATLGLTGMSCVPARRCMPRILVRPWPTRRSGLSEVLTVNHSFRVSSHPGAAGREAPLRPRAFVAPSPYCVLSFVSCRIIVVGLLNCLLTLFSYLPVYPGVFVTCLHLFFSLSFVYLLRCLCVFFFFFSKSLFHSSFILLSFVPPYKCSLSHLLTPRIILVYVNLERTFCSFLPCPFHLFLWLMSIFVQWLLF